MEVRGLIPDRYDAIFYSGLGLFLVALFTSIIVSPAFVALMIVGNIISSYGIYLDFKEKPRTVTGSMGNVFGIIWLLMAWLVVAIFIMFLSNI